MRGKNAYKFTKFIDQIDKPQDKTRYTLEKPSRGENLASKNIHTPSYYSTIKKLQELQ
jgi:hypothetical protein